MPGTLHVVATPIGNLEDMTLRAVRVLREVALIAAEDTRRSRKLLAHHGIATPLVSYHAHNIRTRTPMLLERLAAGHDIAVVTDAGTPGVSDPGAELVEAAANRGFDINPVPGASAPLAAATASGFPMVPLTLFGFAPHRANDRLKWLETTLSTPHTFCFFESPNRMAGTIGQMAELAPNRPIVIARELTKVYQQLIRGTPHSLQSAILTSKGEFTVVVGPSSLPAVAAETQSDDQVVALYRRLLDEPGMSRRGALTAAARASARSSRDVYAAVERAKQQDG